MTIVKVLIKGYVSKDTGGHSCSTVTLVQDKNNNIIIDPGTLSDPNELIEKLKENSLSLNDINIVFLTHSHIDHYKYVGLFPNARILEYWGLWDKDKCIEFNGILNKNIKIIKTPGHSYDSITLVVKNDKGTTIAICGDVFWKKNFPKEDQYAQDNEQLIESRNKILKIADYIIPGHGDMFKVCS